MSENGSSNGTALAVYDRVEPMDFIEKMGKTFALSGAGGCQTESDGRLMALACLCERKTIFEIARRYHLMGGKLVLKAETMLGDFRRAGGTHRWINDGADGQTCTLELTDPRGNVGTTTMTIGKATAAGYVKSGSQWTKRPDQMLRSRCITDGVRKLCPEISSGEYVEEEVEDFAPPVKTVAATTRPAGDVKARQAELQKLATQPVVTTSAVVTMGGTTATVTPVTPTTTREPGDEDVVDVHSAPVAGEVVPFDVPGEATVATPPPHQQTSTLLEIEAVINQAGLTVEKLVASLNAKNGTSITSLDQLAPEAAVKLLGNLRTAIANGAK